jgi:sporulation protein YlmC with PRC-barrel domain
MKYIPSVAAAATVAMAVAALPAHAQQAGQAQQGQMQQQQQAQMGAGECQVIGADFDQQIMDNPELRGQFGGQLSQQLRQMRNTARQLDRLGYTQACEAVAMAIRDIAANPQQYQQQMGATGQPMQQDQQAAQPGAMDPAMQDPMLMQEQAMGFEEMRGRLRVGELIGADVRGVDGQSIGEVDDVVLGQDGDSSYAIVAYGGFLGFGQDLSAVPLSQVQIAADQRTIYVPLSDADLEAAPTFARGDQAWMDDPDWQARNQQFYHGTR